MVAARLPARVPLLIRRSLASALPAAAALTVACALGYALVQFDLRSGANDPQVQLASDAAVRLDRGASPGVEVGDVPIDLATGLAPFVIVFGPDGTVLAAGGRLDGAVVVPPAGVHEAARRTGIDIVTWQPRPGVRIAAVVVPWSGGTVLAGRSLRLVETREDEALLLTAGAWLVGLVVVGASSVVAAALRPSRGGA